MCDCTTIVLVSVVTWFAGTVLCEEPVRPAKTATRWNGDSAHFYTGSYPFVFFRACQASDVYPEDDPATLDFLAGFDTLLHDNQLPLPHGWVDHLHTHAGKRRRILFYQNFPTLRFSAGKDNAAPHDAWKVRFLDGHREEFFTINPLVPPSRTEYARGRWAPYEYLGWNDYFINYGNRKADDLLVHELYDVKRRAWGYDGIFFDLTGSHFTKQGQIRSASDPDVLLNALDRYDALAHTREHPEWPYDRNSAAFLKKLRARNPDPSKFQIWANQAHHSGNAETGENEYFSVLDVNLMESISCTWYESAGWKTGVRVNVDGVWYDDVTPVETRIIPFDETIRRVRPILKQAEFAAGHYNHRVGTVVVDYIRPRYEPCAGGCRAVTDRDAILYSYAAGRVLGVSTFASDYYDTYAPLTRIAEAPKKTGFPQQGHFKWARDPIYFLDLGESVDDSYVTMDLREGKKAILRFFTKGFIVINASAPAQDITVDLSQHPMLSGQNGVSAYYEHLSRRRTLSSERRFEVPAAYYPLADTHTNSARVYSYLDEQGNLIKENADGTDERLGRGQ